VADEIGAFDLAKHRLRRAAHPAAAQKPARAITLFHRLSQLPCDNAQLLICISNLEQVRAGRRTVKLRDSAIEACPELTRAATP
jgi:hypothetical protein